MGSLTLKKAFASLAIMASAVHAVDEPDMSSAVGDMGPAAFMWPPDRVWSAAMDNTAPCGSVASPGNRTDFPIVNGKISLLAQDASYSIKLSVSHEKDPKSNDDFELLIDGDDELSKLDPGHTCIDIPNAPQSARAGDVATLQIKYIADFDKPENQTFYACADIKYVEIAEFKTKIPCIDATIPDDGKLGPQAGPDHDEWETDKDKDEKDEKDEKADEKTGDTSGSGTDDGKSENSDSSSSTPSDDSTESSGKKKLSGGAIAGIVVGAVAGVALIALAGLFIYRRKQQNLTALRQKHSARGVEWNSEQAGKGSVSSSSVRMQNLA